MAVFFRPLTASEIGVLAKNGCSAEDWDRIGVTDGFVPDRMRGVQMFGEVRLGVFSAETDLEGAKGMKTGIYNSRIVDCEIGDDCYIENVGTLSGYQISPHCILRNVGQIYMDGSTSFGNGTEVRVADASGGRKIPIYNKLPAPLAYIAVFYRYREDLLQRIQHLVADYSSSVTTGHGYIGTGVKIEFSGTLVNVRIGDAAEIKGVKHLENGSVNSSENSRVIMKDGVYAKNFIISNGSEACNGVTIENCFIGESCIIRNGFIVKDSLVFADSRLENGEAVSVFAGPYTEIVHKSITLSSGLFSFFTAGPGAVAGGGSDKLAPWHQGITERGVRIGASSTVHWPARIGAYTMVSGNIDIHPDLTDFPFSVLSEKGGTVYLFPGAALADAGVWKKVREWPEEDGRKTPEPLDTISFEHLSPYTVSRMFRGRERLMELQKKGRQEKGNFILDGISVAREDLERGIYYYTLGIRIFIGEKFRAVREVPQNGSSVLENWSDAAGLMLPKSEMDHLLQYLLLELNLNITRVHKKICEMYSCYEGWASGWAEQAALKEFGEDFSPEEVQVRCKEAGTVLYKMILENAAKEFSVPFTVGFGLDGLPGDREKDVEAVRGVVEDNPFICSLLEEIVNLEEQ